MFAEDMTVFFQQSEFAVEASFTTASGVVSASVLYDVQTEQIFGDDVLTDEHVITYSFDTLQGLKAGDYGTVNGVQYRVRDIRLKDDGHLLQAKLAKV